MVMLLHSHRFQPVATSCTTAVAQYENPATATEKSSCYQLGSVGLQFFAVAATGPQKTTYQYSDLKEWLDKKQKQRQRQKQKQMKKKMEDKASKKKTTNKVGKEKK